MKPETTMEGFVPDTKRPMNQDTPSLASASAPGSSARRSGRKRVSTTMQIQGHTVLRKNNYRVDGINYIFDDHEEDSPKEPRKKPKIANKKATKPRVETPAQAKRRQHNQLVDASIDRKKDLRYSFLAEKVDLLRPFIEQNIVDHLLDIRDEKDTLEATPTASTVVQPKMIQKAILRPYQLKGLEFMVKMHEQNLAMILGDEMGLGKTLQTISLLCHLKEQEQLTGPSLIICPLSVLSSWCNEMKQWAPSLKYIQLHSPDQEEQTRQRQHLFENATDYDVVLTTYEMAKVPALTSFWQRLKFHYLVLDEGHKIKSHETQISIMVRKIHAGNKLLLTGTPLQNNLVELWSLLNFLYPEIFTISDPFEEHFNLSENKIDKVFLGKTQKLLELFMLRRLKQEVEKLIPEKLETKVYCPLSKVQAFWYKALLMKDMNTLGSLDGADSDNISTTQRLLLRSLFMQLRKCSNHPFLFNGVESDPDETSLEDLVGASGKLSVLDMLLRSLFMKGHRAVLFTQFTMLLDLIEDYCRLRGWNYCRLDGSTERARRNYLIRRFNEPNSQRFLFLMSTRSGGMGLNLQTADTCILFDSDWNPQQDIQAMARVHRIGQKKKVHVYRLVTAGTIEERMLERAEKKLLLEMVNRESHSKNDATMDPGQDPDTSVRGLTAKEIWEDIKFGSAAVFGDSSNNELPSEDDIATITDRTRQESDSVGKLTGGISLTAKSFDASKEFSNTQLFGGTDFRELRKQQQAEEKKNTPKNLQGIAHLWSEIKDLENKKRVRKSRICQVEGKGSGYGAAYVPVLAANNYTFGGESSVFERELKQCKKVCFEVKKKKKGGPIFENSEWCIVCGDGGDLVCCPQCPNTVHLSCVGLHKAKDFQSCPHHRCSKCYKNRQAAGGVLYCCQSCPLSFCEDCLPEKGVTFLDRLDRYEELGFDTARHNVYINCSKTCEKYAVAELGYKIPVAKNKNESCPKAMILSSHFGSSYDIQEAADAVKADKEASYGRGKQRAARKNYNIIAAQGTRKESGPSLTPAKQKSSSTKSDTPTTSATEISSDSSSSVADYVSPIFASFGNDSKHPVVVDSLARLTGPSGKDADHAIEID